MKADILTTHWGRRIVAAMERGGRFTCRDKEDANGWTTCACGKQDARIPRDHEYGDPLDYGLVRLGVSFARSVSRHDPDTALLILLAIEDRAAEVLAEMGVG